MAASLALNAAHVEMCRAAGAVDSRSPRPPTRGAEDAATPKAMAAGKLTCASDESVKRTRRNAKLTEQRSEKKVYGAVQNL